MSKLRLELQLEVDKPETDVSDPLTNLVMLTRLQSGGLVQVQGAGLAV
jgi:hypothetical protein